MNHLTLGALATCMFELRRSFTFQRISVSVVLALFPPVMLGLMTFGATVAEQASSGQSISTLADFASFLIIFLVALVLLLSLLLWATPTVYSELEGKSWSFIASRPGGRVSMFLGKFLASVLVGFAIAAFAISTCVAIAQFSFGMVRPIETWFEMMGIYLLASLVYGALFSLIGTLFAKRAMVVAAAFLFGFDIVVASIPGALINKFTVRYHLQEIGIEWLGWFLPASGPNGLEEYRFIYGEQWPVWIHIAIIAALTLACLGTGCYVIKNREYITGDEN